MFYFDPLYFVIAAPVFLMSLAAMLFLKFVYSSYSNKINIKNLNGIDTVTRIAEKYSFNISLQQGFGSLTDNYNPVNRIVTLSEDVARKPSVASVGIAAHEMGHVAQHHSSFFLITLRTAIAPAVSIGSQLGYFLFVLGFILGTVNLVWVGILLFSMTTLFAVITLPVELDASRRAVKMISELQLVDSSQLGGVKMVLFAASLTYLAAVFQSLGNLLYFIMRARGMSRD